MDFNIDFNLIQSQKLLLTPQLKQALDILGMNSRELYDYMEKQLETNPVLEFAENYEEQGRQSEEEENLEGWVESLGNNTDEAITENEAIEGASKIYDDDVESRLTLKEYLSLQLNAADITQEQLPIGEYLIDNVDENGYLTASLSEAAAYYNIPVSRVLEVLELLQDFDPPGICSRSLKECLMIQLRQLKCDDPDIFTIVENYLDDIAANRLSRIVRQTGLSRDRLNEILKVIKSLEPKPGREFYRCNEIRVQITDLLVRNVEGSLKAVVNEEAFPEVRISKFYRQVKEQELNEEERKFLQTRINNALWLIKCTEQRKYIILKLCEFIMNENMQYFLKGRMYMKLLTFGKAADKLDMHESILRRAVCGKYLECSWGIMEFADFFI